MRLFIVGIVALAVVGCSSAKVVSSSEDRVSVRYDIVAGWEPKAAELAADHCEDKKKAAKLRKRTELSSYIILDYECR